MNENLDIQIEQHGKEPVVIKLKGEVTHSNFDKLETVISDLFNQNENYSIDFNLENLDHISSAGIGVLISAISQAESNDGVIKFNNVPAKIKEIFSILGLPEEYFPTE